VPIPETLLTQRCQQGWRSMTASSTPLDSIMKNAITWFEIPARRLDQAQAFYEAVLGCTMRREAMGPSEGAVFPYDQPDGLGGALMAGPTAPSPGASGTLIYLDASPSLDAALARVEAAGGRVALPRQSLPPGMGFFAHIIDLDGNRVGLHATA
jgi:uncharacterized protein